MKFIGVNEMAGSTFNYYAGIREDFGSMIDEIGVSCTVGVPTKTVTAFGEHVSTSYADHTEVIWARPLQEVMEIQGIGQLNKEDIRFVAKYNTNIVNEAKITIGSDSYIVLTIDKPNATGSDFSSFNITTIVGYAKKQIT
jgi:hypothetical protein